MGRDEYSRSTEVIARPNVPIDDDGFVSIDEDKK